MCVCKWETRRIISERCVRVISRTRANARRESIGISEKGKCLDRSISRGERKRERERRVGGTFHEIPLGASTDFIIAVSSLPKSKSKTLYYHWRTLCLSTGDLFAAPKRLDSAIQKMDETNKFERKSILGKMS